MFKIFCVLLTKCMQLKLNGKVLSVCLSVYKYVKCTSKGFWLHSYGPKLLYTGRAIAQAASLWLLTVSSDCGSKLRPLTPCHVKYRNDIRAKLWIGMSVIVVQYWVLTFSVVWRNGNCYGNFICKVKWIMPWWHLKSLLSFGSATFYLDGPLFEFLFVNRLSWLIILWFP